MNKFFSHLKTVMKHRREVRKLCFKCGLYRQGLTHDLSKYSPIEFINGVKYFTGTSSPHIGERREKGRSDAWLNHKGHNKHHAEYWNDIVDGKTCPIDIPVNFFVEMMCDRIAACKIYLGDAYTPDAPWNYYRTHKDENQFSDFTRAALETYLNYMAYYGEEKTLQVLKELVKNGKL
jgi:hypothetical protein